MGESITLTHRLGTYEIDFVASSDVTIRIPPSAIVVTDQNVWNLYRHWIGERTHFVLPAGEEQKNLDSFREVIEWLAAHPAPRSTTIVALGGGVIGDLVGFVAATYMRGVDLIQIPTTLLSQVDSSIGGKVGVDLPQGKNLVGAFYPPRKVLICPEALQTLDRRQLINGMAEVWKYGFIRDCSFVELLKGMGQAPTAAQLGQIIRTCLMHKKEVVEADEFERLGLRATLNFGHTVGHAIEQATNYQRYLHGEAISIGMVAEARLGEGLGLTEPGTASFVENCMIHAGLPIHDELLDNPDALIDVMHRDKKANQGNLAFSLLTRIGECKLVTNVAEPDVAAALRNE